MANNFIHGKLSTIQLNGTYFAGLTFSYDEKLSDFTDITYTISGGVTWGIFMPGYNFATGTLMFIYDTLNQPVLSPQNMSPGTLINPMILSPDGTKLYSFNAYSTEFIMPGGPTSGPVKCTCNWNTTGNVTRPSS